MPKFSGVNDSAELQERLNKQSETIATLISVQKSLLELVKASLLKQVDINGPANGALRQALTVAEQGLKALVPVSSAAAPAPAVKSIDEEEVFMLDSPPRIVSKPLPAAARPVAPVSPPPKPVAPKSEPPRIVPKPATKPLPPPPSAKPAASDDDEFDLESIKPAASGDDEFDLESFVGKK